MKTLLYFSSYLCFESGFHTFDTLTKKTNRNRHGPKSNDQIITSSFLTIAIDSTKMNMKTIFFSFSKKYTKWLTQLIINYDLFFSNLKHHWTFSYQQISWSLASVCHSLTNFDWIYWKIALWRFIEKKKKNIARFAHLTHIYFYYKSIDCWSQLYRSFHQHSTFYRILTNDI